VFAAVFDTTYIGPSGGGWNTPTNWSGGTVPANAGGDTFNVTIPDSASAIFDRAGATGISGLTLANNGALTLNSGGTLDVAGTLNLHGLLTISSGNFTAASATGGSVDNTRIVASGTGSVALPASIISYSNVGYGGAMFTADGSGTVLDLASLKSLSVDWNGYGISATNGGRVDLSGVETITAPTRGDWGHNLWITTGTGGQVDLSRLTSIASAGTGNVIVNNGDSISLPALTTAQYAVFSPANGTTVHLPALTTLANGQINAGSAVTVQAGSLTAVTGTSLTGGTGTQFLMSNVTTFANNAVTLNGAVLTTGTLTSIDNSRFMLSGRSTFTIPPSITSYTTYSDGQSNTLFSADGEGTVLNAPSLRTLAISYNHNSTISATSNGVVNLSGLETITMPWNGQFLQINASGGGQIDLSSLRQIGSLGDGYVNFSLSGSSMHVRSLNCVARTNVSVTGAGSELNLDASVLLNSASTLAVGAGSTMRVGTRMEYQMTSESAMATSGAVLHFSGAGVQQLEVGGFDSGNADPGNSGNFGFGQLIVGQDSKPTVLELRDAIDNGNRAGASPEALYLFGLGGPDGLVIKGGSALLIRNLNVYSKQAGVWTSLQGLFPAGQDIIPYSGGFVSRSAAAMPGAWNVDADGRWSEDANWLLLKPNGVGMNATFGRKITAPRTVTADVAVNIGSMLFDSDQPYTIAGQAITMAAGDARATIEANGSADQTISARINLMSDMEVTNLGTGTLRLAGYIGNPFSKTLTTHGNVVIGPTATLDNGPGSRLVVSAGNTDLYGDIGLNTAVFVGTDGRLTLVGPNTAVLTIYTPEDICSLTVAAGAKVVLARDLNTSVAGMTAAPVAVPEPTTMGLALAGAIGLLGWAWHKRRWGPQEDDVGVRPESDC
jgi:hypothetical protein